jgi:hypothetical protein
MRLIAQTSKPYKFVNIDSRGLTLENTLLNSTLFIYWMKFIKIQN